MSDYHPIERPFEEREGIEYGPYPVTVVPKTDVLCRDRLPPTEGMELEYREYASAPTDAAFIMSAVPRWLFGILLINSLVLCPLQRYTSSALTSVLMWPLWILLSVGLGSRMTRLTADRRLIAACFVVPLLIPLAMKYIYASSEGDDIGLAAVILAVRFMGALSDHMGTHYYYFMTANPRLDRDGVCRRRAWWGARFNPEKVRALERGLRTELDALNGDDSDHKAVAIASLLTESSVMAEYPIGLLILPFYVLLIAKYSHTVVVVIPTLLAFIWAYRKPSTMPRIDVFLISVVFGLLHSWLCWGRWDPSDESKTPGLFVSPAGSWKKRMFATIICLFGVGSVTVPPVWTWGRGVPLTGKWVVSMLLDALTMLLLPVIMLVSTLTATSGAALGACYKAVECPGSPEIRARCDVTLWECYARRLAESHHPLEQEHLWLGVHKEGRYPVLVHRKLVDHHMHVLGPTGSGKTALGSSPMVEQLNMRGDAGKLVLDLKGDMALFEAARLSAEKAGLPFKYFTNELGYSTYVFNPLDELNDPNVSYSHVIETLMNSMKLDYGVGYGRSFFTSQNHEALLNIFHRYPNLRTYRDLLEKTGPEFFERSIDRDHVKELIAALQKLSEVQPLNWVEQNENPSPVAANAIRMADVIRNNHVVYFWLPAIGETSTVRDIADAALSSLIMAAKAYRREFGQSKQCYVFIDEYQRMASESLVLFLQQGRSYGFSVNLSNQTLSDLRTKDAPNLLDTTMNNTAVRQMFSPCSPEVEELLIRQSGETVHAMPELFYSQDRQDSFDPNLRYAETPFLSLSIGERRNRNDLKSYPSELKTSIVQFPRDSGYTCYGGHWFAIETDFHIDQKTYTERLSAPWPSGNESTIVARRDSARLSPPTSRVKLLRDDGHEEQLPAAAVAELLVSDNEVFKWQERLQEIYEKRFPHA